MSKGEDFIVGLLKEARIDFEREKTFPDLRRKDFLRFDFYCHSVDGAPLIIEYDGEYHFKPIRGRQALMKQQEYDRRKNAYCLSKKIKLIRVPFWKLDTLTKDSLLYDTEFVVTSKWHSDILMQTQNIR